MACISIGHHGSITIQDDPVLATRHATLWRRVSGTAATKPIGKQIYAALLRWERAVKTALQMEYDRLEEYKTYTLEAIPLEDLEEAERLNAAGQATARAQGATYPCRGQGCQARVLVIGTLCGRCQHDN